MSEKRFFACLFCVILSSCQLLEGEEVDSEALYSLQELNALESANANVADSSSESVGFCGDGITDGFNGEQCDEGIFPNKNCAYGASACSVCSSTCTTVPGNTSFCGDGVIDKLSNEQCDDGNAFTESCPYGASSCSVCNEKCEIVTGNVSFCGDGIVDGFNDEQCDEGKDPSAYCRYGDTSCSVCSKTCKIVAGDTSFCGDGIVDSQQEKCDDGNALTESCPYGASSCMVCDNTCHISPGETSFCGDGKVDFDKEQCDDGNSTDFDGCNTSCNFAPETMGEVGTVTISSTSTTVSLQRTYVEPVVFLSPLSYNETDVAVPRITYVGSDSFNVEIQDAEYLTDGTHANETVFYMVLEKGLWQLENNAVLQVDTVNTDRISQSTAQKGTAKQIVIDSAFNNQRPSILTQIQAVKDTQFVGTRHKHVSDTIFEISMHHQEKSTTPHDVEKIGWMAIQQGSGTWSNLDYEVATQSQFNHSWKTLTSSFTENSLVFASLASRNGADPAFLRYQLSLPNVQVRLQEDQSRESETNHINEDVSFIVFSEAGLLWAWPLPL